VTSLPDPAPHHSGDFGDPLQLARDLFLDDANTYGCAEVTLIALQEHFGLPAASDSAPAMALNGGIAYSGGVCGAISGAALAVGRVAARHVEDHRRAKREARCLLQNLMTDFTHEFGSVDCRSLTGYDFLQPDSHHAFIESGVWRETCLRQILFAIAATCRRVESAPWAGADHSRAVAAEGLEAGDAG
jgi:C_GCAxxG_C_C family probable redox protein